MEEDAPRHAPEAARPEAVEPAAEVRRPAVEERGLRRPEEMPRAPIADVIPDGALEIVDHLVERFGPALDREAAFKAKSLVAARVQARLERAAAREPEFAHILGEVAEDVLRSLGRLMASPDAARHARDALLYFFEGYGTRDGERLYARIEPAIREAVRKAEEAGIPDAEYRVKQFVLDIVDILARAGERYRRQALEGISTVEKALRVTALAGLSATALYSVYSGLYSEAVASSVASAVALAEVGQFREAVQYAQKAAKALYEAAKDVFEQVKITVQRLVELFVEAVTRVLAWIDEHKAYLFLMAAVAAGVVALSAALNMWGLVELEKLAYAASLTPFIPAGVEKYSREEAFKILREAPDPYERFKEIAKAAIAKNEKLAEPWESLRVLIMPKPSEERRLMMGKAYRELDEGKKKALFYAFLALEEAFGVYRSVLREAAEAVQRVEVGEEPFKKVVYAADLGRLERLAEGEEEAFEKALRTLRERLNEYAVEHDLGDLLNVDEGKARRLAETGYRELPEFSGVSFGVKALAALLAYREHALGRRGAYGTAAKYWLEEGGSAWLLYYAPNTAYDRAEKARVERPATVEGMIAEALRRLFLRPGADRYSRFVEELTKGGKLALELEKAEKTEKGTETYLFRLLKLEEGGRLAELEGIKLRISKVGEGEEASIVYTLELDARWRELFKQELEMVEKAAEELRERLPVEDPLPYMLGWPASDVAISGERGARELRMSSSHLWQVAETKVLFGWSDAVRLHVGLTLEGPKLQLYVHAPLSRLDEAIKRSAGLAVGGGAEGGWLRRLGVEAGSWDGLKRWIAGRWDEVVDAVKEQLKDVEVGSDFDLTEALKELEGLGKRLDDDKVAREAVAPALLLMQAEKLGVNEESLRYFGMVVSGAIGGDGYVSAARGEVGLASGERPIALLWGAAFKAHGIKAEVEGAGRGFQVVAYGDDAARLAGLYFLFGPPLLEGRDERVINHKLAEAVKLGAKGLNIRWEEPRRTKRGLAAKLTLSEGGAAVKYNVYLRGDAVELQFRSTDRSRVELAARLLRLAGVRAEVKKESSRDVWYVKATTDMLAAGREELRKAIAEIVRKAVARGRVDEKKAGDWLKKLEEGLTLREGWPRYEVKLAKGALMVRFSSTNSGNVEREARRLRDMGLVEGRHFMAKMPEGGKAGYVSILKEGLAYAARLSIRGSEGRRELAADFVEYILQRAGEEGEDVRKKAEEIVKRGKEVGSLRLAGFEKEVDGRLVKVIGGGAEPEEGGSSRKLLRIAITAEVGGVRRDYAITFGKYNNVVGRAVARADAPGGREADAERFSALIKALTGREPNIRRMKDGTIIIECYKGHLEGFMRYAELADAIEGWLEEMG